MQRSAITNKIKTEFTTYFGKVGSSGAVGDLIPMRVSDNTVVGATDEITSDVMIPETRIPSENETGTSSSSGDISTEWNIDEQDDWFASVFCSEWDETDWDSDEGTGTKTLKLGVKRDIYEMVKKYPQSPAEWKVFTGLQLNQLQMAFDLNSFVKLTWSWLGANNPKAVTVDPYSSTKYKDALTTKSFKTLEGSFYIDDALEETASRKQIRQASNINITINNNKERTDALFETDAIEMSDGDFAVTGSFDIWKADSFATDVENLAIDGTKKYLFITVTRGNVSYTIQMYAKLMTPSESKDGNKLKTTINFGVYDKDGIKIIKTVTE